MSVYTLPAGGNIRLAESHLYGSSKLGVSKPEVDLDSNTESGMVLRGIGSGEIANFTRSKKVFELSNHLRNVLTTVSDRKY